jgi:uncharacterized protein YukE
LTPKPKANRLKAGVKAAKAWPTKAADIVDEGINVVEMAAARKALETARKMKGDPDAVRAVAEKWRAAGQQVSDAKSPLHLSWADLLADWEGGAYDAFKENMSYNAQVAHENGTAILDAERDLLDLSLMVTNAYNKAVSLTTMAAEQIEPALGNIFTGKKDDKRTITNALLGYVSAIGEAENSLRSAVSEQKAGLGRFATNLAKLQPPAEFPTNAENPKRWIYK